MNKNLIKLTNSNNYFSFLNKSSQQNTISANPNFFLKEKHYYFSSSTSPQQQQQQQQKEKIDRVIEQTNLQKEKLEKQGTKVQKDAETPTKELSSSIIKEQAQAAKDSLFQNNNTKDNENIIVANSDKTENPLWKHSLKGQEVPYTQAPSHVMTGSAAKTDQTNDSSLGETIKEKAQQAKDSVQDAVSQVKESASQFIPDTSSKDTDVKKEASSMAETIKEKAQQAKDYVQDKASQMKDSLSNVMGTPTKSQESSQEEEKEEEEEPKTITRQIKEDHDSMRSFMQQYETHFQAKNYEQAQHWFNQLGWLVAQHSIAEELILYPFLDQKQIPVKENLSQHQLVKEHFSSLEKKKDCQESDFQQQVQELFSILKSHMDLEEKSELPKLEQRSMDKELYLEGRRFLRRKLLAPTHAHPSAPQQFPVFETLAGLLALPVDKFQDFFFLEFPSNEEVQKALKNKQIQQ